MKPRYTVVVTDNDNGQQVLDFDMATINFSVKTSTERPMATLTVSGVCFLDSYKTKAPNINLPGPCGHDWINYQGLSEEFKVCGICGSKK